MTLVGTICRRCGHGVLIRHCIFYTLCTGCGLSDEPTQPEVFRPRVRPRRVPNNAEELAYERKRRGK